jgi:hypothetical protein
VLALPNVTQKIVNNVCVLRRRGYHLDNPELIGRYSREKRMIAGLTELDDDVDNNNNNKGGRTHTSQLCFKE